MAMRRMPRSLIRPMYPKMANSNTTMKKTRKRNDEFRKNVIIVNLYDDKVLFNQLISDKNPANFFLVLLMLYALFPLFAHGYCRFLLLKSKESILTVQGILCLVNHELAHLVLCVLLSLPLQLVVVDLVKQGSPSHHFASRLVILLDFSSPGILQWERVQWLLI